jgi:RNA polymerase sigma factor (sigma-70 family)
MKKVNIKQLGIEFKRTKSEKTFKQLFDACKPGTIAYYKKFQNPIELLEDCYNETFIAIWNDIDKYDVEKYSISTMIYLKMKQNIIRHYKSVGGQFQSVDIDDPIVVNKVITQDMDEMTYNLEEDYIADESVDTLWSSIKTILNNETSYNILYDKYANNMKSKEIADKYETKLQNVLNRIFNAKKKIESNKEIYNEFIK